MQALKDKVSELLKQGAIDGFLGLRRTAAEPVPHLFTADRAAELDDLTIGRVRYQLAQVLRTIASRHPDEKIGIMCRACDERALIELFKNAQLEKDKVEVLGIPCTDELARACDCPNTVPSSLVFGESNRKLWDRSDIAEVEAMAVEERFGWWVEQLGKCIKCYGCRNACPVCFCKVCTLQDDPLVKKGEIPAELPAFQLTRAYHMVGRCIDCGLCQEACPMDIPVRTLYRKVREVVSELLDYRPGESEGKSPVTELGDGSFPIQ